MLFFGLSKQQLSFLTYIGTSALLQKGLLIVAIRLFRLFCAVEEHCNNFYPVGLVIISR